MKVLIVDDSPIVLARLLTLISDLDNIEIVGNAGEVGEAIQSIHKLRPDIVVLDIGLIGGSGCDVLRHVKLNYPSIIVIMLTNYPFQPYRQKCEELGADYFFDKSEEFDRVPEVLSEIVNK